MSVIRAFETRRVLLLALAVAALSACSNNAPPAVENAPAAATAPAETAAPAPLAQLPAGTLEAVALDVGLVLDADGRVTTPTERVRANDAVHVSLVTVGEAAAAMLDVEWRDAAGAIVGADERAITAAGPAVHTFTRRVEGGWAPGRYEVDVRINGESAGVRAFEVR